MHRLVFERLSGNQGGLSGLLGLFSVAYPANVGVNADSLPGVEERSISGFEGNAEGDGRLNFRLWSH